MQWLTYESLLKEEGYSSRDRSFIERAFIFANDAHTGQKRASGEPYVSHVIATATHTARLHMDAKTVSAALLHDTIEDCSITAQTIEREFGSDVAFLVEGVTKVSHVRHQESQRHIESLRKMFLAVAEDVRVVIIKLMDRLHNMETIRYIRPEKQKRIALETLEIYAPIAYRLGMGTLKGRLEDLAFPVVYPEAYQSLKKKYDAKVPKTLDYLSADVKPCVESTLAKDGVNFVRIDFRQKHLYSLWKKLQSCDGDIDRITDLLAMRIIVHNIEDCYRTLGIIHSLWKPLPGRVKDYIALPKPNGYRSLHTTVFCIDNNIMEFQIRTATMHEEAERGIAAHWAYTESGKPKKGIAVTHTTAWIKDLQDWQKNIDAHETTEEDLLEVLKIDFFRDRIFVLTPKGEVIDLPAGSTPIDFAYKIHTDIGNHMISAKINGKITSFSHILTSGDIVEIVTQKKRRPNSEWLSVVKTSLARTHIRTALRREELSPVHSPIRAPLEEHAPHYIHITAQNRKGLIPDIIRIFEHFRLHPKNISSHTKNNPLLVIVFSCRMRDKKQTAQITQRLSEVVGITEVLIRDSE